MVPVNYLFFIPRRYHPIVDNSHFGRRFSAQSGTFASRRKSPHHRPDVYIPFFQHRFSARLKLSSYRRISIFKIYFINFITNYNLTNFIIIYFDIATGSSISVIIRVYSRPYIIKAGIIEYLNIPTWSNIFPISVIDS